LEDVLGRANVERAAHALQPMDQLGPNFADKIL
jgi:hypothetical protein